MRIGDFSAFHGIRNEFGDAFKRRYLQDTGRTVDLKWLNLGGGTSDILARLIAPKLSAAIGLLR